MLFIMIESAAFGTMTIHGKPYSTDLIIFPDGHVEEGWWRKSGHLLLPDDILSLVDTEPALIVIGTGVHGRMRLDASLTSFLAQRGIRLIAAPNSKAIAAYNEEQGKGVRIGAGFHLTC